LIGAIIVGCNNSALCSGTALTPKLTGTDLEIPITSAENPAVFLGFSQSIHEARFIELTD